MSLPSEFFVTLVSDESQEFFDSNTNGGSFTNKLPSALLFKENYVVALTEIYIPKFWINLDEISTELPHDPRKKREVAEHSSKSKRAINQSVYGSDHLEINLAGLNWRVHISPLSLSRMKGKYFEFKHLFPILYYNIKYDDPKPGNVEEVFKLLMEKLDGMIPNIDINQEYEQEAPPAVGNFFYLHFPIECDDINSENPKFKNMTIIIKARNYSSFMEFLNEMIKQIPKNERKLDVILKAMSLIKYGTKDIQNYQKGINDILEKVKNITTSKVEITDEDLEIERQNQESNEIIVPGSHEHQIPHILYIYSDIVEPHIYANKLLQLLRIIPYYSGDIRHGIPEYYPLSKTYFDTISIVVTNRGREPHFGFFRIQPIYVQLHFKKV